MNMDWRLKRLKKRITLTEIAKELGVSISYLCQFESGKKKMSADRFNAYACYIEKYNHANDVLL